MSATLPYTACVFVCFVWNVLLWHVHLRKGIRQTDKQTQIVRSGQKDVRTFLPCACRGKWLRSWSGHHNVTKVLLWLKVVSLDGHFRAILYILDPQTKYLVFPIHPSISPGKDGYCLVSISLWVKNSMLLKIIEIFLGTIILFPSASFCCQKGDSAPSCFLV